VGPTKAKPCSNNFFRQQIRLFSISLNYTSKLRFLFPINACRHAIMSQSETRLHSGCMVHSNQPRLCFRFFQGPSFPRLTCSHHNPHHSLPSARSLHLCKQLLLYRVQQAGTKVAWVEQNVMLEGNLCRGHYLETIQPSFHKEPDFYVIR